MMMDLRVIKIFVVSFRFLLAGKDKCSLKIKECSLAFLLPAHLWFFLLLVHLFLFFSSSVILRCLFLRYDLVFM